MAQVELLQENTRNAKRDLDVMQAFDGRPLKAVRPYMYFIYFAHMCGILSGFGVAAVKRHSHRLLKLFHSVFLMQCPH
jgi:hypothetical protein